MDDYLESGVELEFSPWRYRHQLRVNWSSIKASIKDECSCGDESGINKRRVNQLPVSFSFVTPCVSPFSLNHSSKRFDSCRLRRGTSYSSHLPIDFSLFNSMNSILPINCLESRRKLYDSLNISVIFRVSISISRDKKEGNQSLFNDEEWIAGIDRVSNGAELVKYASSRGIDFSVTLQSV